jgi:basic amino acid/polyamine antiporter, APA family
VINSIIGAGIFGLPARAFALAGTYSLFAYLVSALAIGLIIVCFAEVGSRFKGTGGPYLYARTAFGSLVGFEIGWLTWLARLSACAALCNLWVGYLAYFVPAAATDFWRTSLIVGAMTLLTTINVLGVRLTAVVTNLFTVGKLIPLLVVAVVGLFFVDADRFSLVNPPGYATFSQTALLLVFAFGGFESAMIPAGEMRDPRRHLPFALLTGLTVVVLVYVTVQVVCIGTLPELAQSDRPVIDASRRFLGAPGAAFIALGAVLSIGGTMNALMLATPRLLFAMAEHGQLPAVFLTTHPRFRTPIVAILLSGALTLAFTLSTTFIAAATISAIIRLIGYTMTSAALPVLRRRAAAPPPAFLAPAGRVVSIGAVVLGIWLLSSSTWAEVQVVGLTSAVGLILYFIFGRSPRRTTMAIE